MKYHLYSPQRMFASLFALSLVYFIGALFYDDVLNKILTSLKAVFSYCFEKVLFAYHVVYGEGKFALFLFFWTLMSTVLSVVFIVKARDWFFLVTTELVRKIFETEDIPREIKFCVYAIPLILVGLATFLFIGGAPPNYALVLSLPLLIFVIPLCMAFSGLRYIWNLLKKYEILEDEVERISLKHTEEFINLFLGEINDKWEFIAVLTALGAFMIFLAVIVNNFVVPVFIVPVNESEFYRSYRVAFCFFVLLVVSVNTILAIRRVRESLRERAAQVLRVDTKSIEKECFMKILKVFCYQEVLPFQRNKPS